MVLDEGGYHEARLFAEVYDHAQPSPAIEVLPVEPFAVRHGIVFAHIWAGDGVEDRAEMVQHLRTPSSQVIGGAFVEDDAASVGVARLPEPSRHVTLSVMVAASSVASARVNLSASSLADRACK